MANDTDILETSEQENTIKNDRQNMTPEDNCKLSKYSEDHKEPYSHPVETVSVKSEVGAVQPIQQVLMVEKEDLTAIVTEVQEPDDKTSFDKVEDEDSDSTNLVRNIVIDKPTADATIRVADVLIRDVS